MDYALIKQGTVQNVIVADEAFISQIAPEWDHIERIDTPAEQALGVGIGWGWDGTQFVRPAPTPEPPAPEPTPPEWAWYIDIGPFYDRFGAAKMAVLTNPDAGLKAILSDLNIRKWVDLERSDVAQALAYVGSVVPAVDATLQNAILTTPVANIENLALRKLYFA